ncbi:hypothetical protein BDZ89DRAFT_1130941 [Hymenopellis radicata]|nr:hypothetical protein BDZ89DRAFT_1130941 [Hymenopellis radicata]
MTQLTSVDPSTATGGSTRTTTGRQGGGTQPVQDGAILPQDGAHINSEFEPTNPSSGGEGGGATTANVFSQGGPSPNVGGNISGQQGAILGTGHIGRSTNPQGDTTVPTVPQDIVERIAILNALRKLPRVRAIKLIGAVDNDPVDTVDIVTMFQNNPTSLERILKAVFLPSHDTLSNLAFADPQNYKHVIQTQSNKIVKGSVRYAHSFFTVGICSYSELVTAGPNSRGRQISVIPLKGLWERSAAVLHAIFDLTGNDIRFTTFSGGVNFSTVRASAAAASGSGNATPQRYTARRAMNGMYHGDATRPWDEDVPIFDGRTNFKYKQYHKLPVIDTELEEGDVVFVIFTVNLWGEASDKKPSLNVQVVIKLRDAAKRKDSRVPAVPLPDYLARLQDFGLSGSPLPDVVNEFSDDEEDGGI